MLHPPSITIEVPVIKEDWGGRSGGRGRNRYIDVEIYIGNNPFKKSVKNNMNFRNS